MSSRALDRNGRRVFLGAAMVSAMAWLYLLAGAGTGMYPHDMAMLLPAKAMMMGMQGAMSDWTAGYAMTMFVMWWVMMIAMMLSGAIPVILLFSRTLRRYPAVVGVDLLAPERLRQNRATVAFAGGYLVMWGIFSIAAVHAQWLLERGGLLSAMMMPTSDYLGAGLLLAAGIWQITPLKSACLSHCRLPLGFLAKHWRPGPGGAFRTGLVHGAYCLGCCWFLMALLFYAGVMNLVWIAGLTLFVIVEKYMAGGPGFAKIAGFIFLLAGAVVLV